MKNIKAKLVLKWFGIIATVALVAQLIYAYAVDFGGVWRLGNVIASFNDLVMIIAIALGGCLIVAPRIEKWLAGGEDGAGPNK